MFHIMWNGGYGIEEIDVTDTRVDADYLVGEYSLAYGGRVWIMERD